MKIIRVLKNELCSVGINENVFKAVEHDCFVGSEIVFTAVNLERNIRVGFAVFDCLAKCRIVVICRCAHAEIRSVDGSAAFFIRSCNVEYRIIYAVNSVIGAHLIGCRLAFGSEILRHSNWSRFKIENRGNQHQD